MGILNELGGFVKDREDDEDEKVVDRKDIEDEMGDETEEEVPEDKPFKSPLEDEGNKKVDVAELMKHYDNIQKAIDSVDIINSGGNNTEAFEVEKIFRQGLFKFRKFIDQVYKEKE
jgi:hypothetical protein